MRLEGCKEAFDMHEEDNDGLHKAARADYEGARIDLYQLGDFEQISKS